MHAVNAKQQLRRKVFALKDSYPEKTLQAYAAEIYVRIEQSPFFREATRIACYHALPGEVHTTIFLERWYVRKRIFLPAVDGEQLKFYPYQGEKSLKTGAFGIMEPATDRDETGDDLDLAIIPGVAFDRRMNRLGRGKGFYDRFLSTFRKPVIGICFHFQLFDVIPVDAYDCKMTQIITEQETIG
ncbi:MAG: 5-formyltetrahydrofolate cyclo-ligase [Tannerella sp.]|jgi:5-formyltetrahydrofolate cyclo-ligase|nr:5-formyltetrahydrofolate cyclo-ligase [Tannerella sp.]